MERIFCPAAEGDEIREVGGDIRREGIGESERVVRELVREEIMVSLKKIIGGKAAGMDGLVVKIFKKGGINIIDWLMRIFNKCMGSVVVPEDWKAARIVAVFKGKGDRRDCAE